MEVLPQQRSVEYLSVPLERRKIAVSDESGTVTRGRLEWGFRDGSRWATAWDYSSASCNCHNDTDLIRRDCLPSNAKLIGSILPAGSHEQAYLWEYNTAFPYNQMLQRFQTTAVSGDDCLIIYQSKQWIRGFDEQSAASSVNQQWYFDFTDGVKDPDAVFTLPPHCPPPIEC